ncbi:MAG: ribokinase [Rhodothermales bacterium]
MTGSVLVVGSANMDLVVKTSRFPRPGETVLGREFGMYAGGKGANQAVACARLGGDVVFVACMGRDVFRDRLFESLTRDGIDLSHVRVDEEASTGVALITVDESGQNEIVVASGSNMHLRAEDMTAHEELFDAADVLLLQLEVPMETVVRAARMASRCGTRVILNPAPAAELPEELFQVVDYLTPNESEAEILSGHRVDDYASAARAAGALVDRGVPNVIVTLGSRGALYAGVRGVRSYAAYPTVSVDTTAAGDAFSGAIAFALSRGDDVEKAVAFANAVAACCVRRMGAQTAMPTLDEVDQFIADRPDDVPDDPDMR